MSYTVGSPPARATINQFAVTRLVDISGGSFSFQVDVTDSSGAAVPRMSFTCKIGNGSGVGVAYNAAGELDRIERTDPSITVANAFTAFVSQAGNFAAKAAALESWARNASRQLMP
jgi:hypothetical protein